ncbi:MAG: hypothetical protein K2K97_05885 [Muribaculaceae bacterium]|nr:hypothetical protein [Muribaculaceae bacterium]
MNLKELKKSLLTATYEDAVEALTTYISAHPEDDEALTARGMKHWSAGKRSLAINDYLAAIAINPESSARHALRAASDILDYRNTDLYNP